MKQETAVEQGVLWREILLLRCERCSNACVMSASTVGFFMARRENGLLIIMVKKSIVTENTVTKYVGVDTGVDKLSNPMTIKFLIFSVDK